MSSAIELTDIPAKPIKTNFNFQIQNPSDSQVSSLSKRVFVEEQSVATSECSSLLGGDQTRAMEPKPDSTPWSYSIFGTIFSPAPLLPAEISARVRAEGDATIQAALVVSPSRKRIPIERLDVPLVREIASDVNVATLHFSGNCVLLSRCFLYNLLNHQLMIAAQNTYPVTKGVSFDKADRVIFGRTLTQIHREPLRSVDAVDRVLMPNYRATGERFYVLNSVGYQVPIMGSTGHSLNAVILFNQDGQPFVQYVDAWKTSDQTPTKAALSARYKEATFYVYTLRDTASDSIHFSPSNLASPLTDSGEDY